MNTQLLGGTRQSSPLEDEMTYPLTSDEYSIIKDNLSVDKFSNWESFLLTTGFTFLISAIISCLSNSFEAETLTNEVKVVKINMLYVITLILYGSLSVGAFLSFFAFRATKKKTEKPIHRLEAKITNHLKKATDV